MKYFKILISIFFFNFLYSCADYKVPKEKQYYLSSGFALIYKDKFYDEKLVKKRLDNNTIGVIHNTLKVNTPIRITNPENLKSIETKVYKKSDFPKIFNAVISEKISLILDLDKNNPFIEIAELKKNKTFIAKKSNTFEEEKKLLKKAPVDEIQMDVISNTSSETKKKSKNKKQFIIVISDFYYLDSAENLKNELIKKTENKNISIKKINDNKYRLLMGPFIDFNALKTSYISLNNLGFEDLNIYKE